MKKNYAYLLLVTVLLLSKANTLKAQVNVNDSLALVDLYNSTHGKHWKNKSAWLTAKPVIEWYGITVSANRVTEIHLNGNNLKGKIPSSIGNLTKLAIINLDINQLSGRIPAEFGNITTLTDLDLYYNQLSGHIPHQVSNALHLYRLNLAANQLSGSIPPELGNLSNLFHLELSYNQLSGSIPPELGNLSNLDHLGLSYNQLSGRIPSELGKLIKQLESLSLDNNQLSGSIPSKLGKLSRLFYLNLSNNQLSGSIPWQLGNLEGLGYLFLQHNQLSGSIPTKLGQLRYLSDLRLQHNQLKGPIPNTFSKLTRIRQLNLRDNYLRDTVPSFLATLPELEVLDIVNNHFVFDGMETFAKHNFRKLLYNYEKKIPIHQTNNTLSVYAGGTLSNNTYKWYQDGSLVSTINGDSTFAPTGSGVYYVEVKNSIATELTLSSDTIHYSSSSGLQQDAIAALLSNNKNSFSVYPNPAKNVVTVSFVANGNYTIKLIDVNGNILQTKTGIADKTKNILQLNVGNYASGNYFITITDEATKTQTLKLNKE